MGGFTLRPPARAGGGGPFAPVHPGPGLGNGRGSWWEKGCPTFGPLGAEGARVTFEGWSEFDEDAVVRAIRVTAHKQTRRDPTT